MHARVSTFYGSADKLDTLGGEVPPEVAALPGFQGAYVLVQRETGKALTITLWESEEAMQSSTAKANQLRTEMVQDVGGTEPASVELFEVISRP